MNYSSMAYQQLTVWGDHTWLECEACGGHTWFGCECEHSLDNLTEVKKNFAHEPTASSGSTRGTPSCSLSLTQLMILVSIFGTQDTASEPPKLQKPRVQLHKQRETSSKVQNQLRNFKRRTERINVQPRGRK